jgi:outer membrane biosynthesis protein TonB
MALLDTKHKRKSFTLTSILLSIMLIVLFYIGLNYLDPPPESGISVNFGTTNFGSGRIQPKEKIKSQPVNKPEPVEEQQVEEQEVQPQEEVVEEDVTEKATEKVLTQDSEESIKIKQQEEAKRKAEEAAKKAKAEAERIEREKREAEEKARKEKEDKKKKLDDLMGGLNKSDGTATGGEGDDKLPGDKGQIDGNPYASSYYGTPGSGSGGSGYGLKGRSLANSGKVPQECNEEGRVVVKIEVDRSGKVISAVPGIKGTTNNHPCLLKPAKETAFKHRWNPDSKAPARQIGFVVVNFKLGE